MTAISRSNTKGLTHLGKLDMVRAGGDPDDLFGNILRSDYRQSLAAVYIRGVRPLYSLSARAWSPPYRTTENSVSTIPLRQP